MTTKSDRNLSHAEAVAAGLMPPVILKRNSDWKFTPPGAGMTYPDQLTPILPPEVKKQLQSVMKTEAVKADEGKVDWSLVPFEALEDMVRVLEFGAKKYSRNNWQTNGGFEWLRVFSSTMRHMFAWASGEDNDKESGLSHISHAQCNLLFLAYYIRNKGKFTKDNRNVR